MENAVEQKIKASLVNGKLPCAAAFKIAEDLRVPLREVGDAANRLKIKICSCRLGCFP
jgi:hypothetical protein